MTGLQAAGDIRLEGTDYRIWSVLDDKVTWRPAGLRAVEYWEWWRWRAALVGGGVTAFGILLLAIRRPEQG